MDKEVRDELTAVNNEVMAVQHLLFGLAMALKRRNLGLEILNEAFDHADTLAMAAIGSKDEPSINKPGGRMLELLAEMRAAMLS